MSEGGRVTVRPEVAARVLDGEAVVLNLSNGLYFHLEGPGAVMWELIQAGATVEAIVDAVRARFDVSAARVAADVAALLGDLEREALVTWEDGLGPASPAAPPAPRVGRAPYASPRVTKHTDMAHFFGSEPPIPPLDAMPRLVL
jgi:hypothetical protein